VAIPGYDGRAGMAALITHGEPDLVALHACSERSLPSYARPLFLRLQPEFETTARSSTARSTWCAKALIRRRCPSRSISTTPPQSLCAPDRGAPWRHSVRCDPPLNRAKTRREGVEALRARGQPYAGRTPVHPTGQAELISESVADLNLQGPAFTERRNKKPHLRPDRISANGPGPSPSR